MLPNFEYQVIYSKRRTVSLIIKRDGCLTVRAPKRISQKEIIKILQRKSAWIKKHLSRMDGKKPPKHEFKEGEKFQYLGQDYPLRLADRQRKGLVLKDNEFFLSRKKADKAKKVFIDWYAKQAAEIIFARAKHYAGLMEVEYKRISITSAQTRWGSCGNHGTVNFSWRLALAPLPIIDSVVVHELAHLAHHNHSKTFWGKVYDFYPDYKTARKWLNEHGHTLQI